MGFRLFFLIAALSSALGQESTQPSAQQQLAQPPLLFSLPADTVIATIDGQQIKAGELQAVLRSISDAQRQMALADPRGLLEQIGLLRRLSGEAEKEGLDKKSPYKEQLEYNRMTFLTNAFLNYLVNNAPVEEDEVKKFYQQNLDAYTVARIKIIYIPFSPNPKEDSSGEGRVLSETEARQKAETIYAQLQKGADFVKMVREHSGDPTSAAKDGDFMPVRKNDNLPAAIKDAVFSMKPGQISPPIRQPNGFYIIRLESLQTEPFDQVKGSLVAQLRQVKVDEFIRKARQNIQIEIQNPGAFSPAPAQTK